MDIVLVDHLVASALSNGGELDQPVHHQALSVLNMEYWYAWSTQINHQKLETSLRSVLGVYPAVAGRIANMSQSISKDGDPIARVSCNNKGVSYQVVQTCGGVSQILRSPTETDAGPYLNRLCWRKVIAGESPLLSVKLTLFSDGGCVLGLVWNHLVFDGSSFEMFFSDWSRVHNGHDIQPICQSPRNSLATHAKPMGAFSLWLAHKYWRKMVSGKRTILHFSDSKLQDIKRRAEMSAGTWVSTSEALLAHLLPLMLESFCRCNCSHINVGLVVNLRGKVIGCGSRKLGTWNCASHFRYKPGESTSVALGIHESVRAAVAEPALLHAMHSPHKDRHPVFYWNDQAKLSGDADFGVGKPSHVERAVGAAATVFPSVQGGMDVILSQNQFGLRTWVPRRHQVLHRVLHLAVLPVTALLLYSRKSTHVGQKMGLCGVIGVMLATITALNKAHDRRVDACFSALANHPDL